MPNSLTIFVSSALSFFDYLSFLTIFCFSLSLNYMCSVSSRSTTLYFALKNQYQSVTSAHSHAQFWPLSSLMQTVSRFFLSFTFFSTRQSLSLYLPLAQQTEFGAFTKLENDSFVSSNCRKIKSKWVFACPTIILDAKVMACSFSSFMQ